jgi:hypothetical protein
MCRSLIYLVPFTEPEYTLYFQCHFTTLVLLAVICWCWTLISVAVITQHCSKRFGSEVTLRQEHTLMCTARHVIYRSQCALRTAQNGPSPLLHVTINIADTGFSFIIQDRPMN